MTRRLLVSSSRARGRAGFSLLELLLTVAIILILTTLYWSPSRRSTQLALQASCRTHLQKLYIALNLYATDQQTRFPAVSGAATSAEALAPLVPRYTSDTTIFICPGSKDSVPPSGGGLSKATISYSYYMGCTQTNQQVLASDRQVDTKPKPIGSLAFSEKGNPPGNNHGDWGGNLLFCDGHVEFSPPKTRVPLLLDPGEILLNP